MCQPLWIYRPRRLRARKWLCKSNEIDWKLFFGQSWPQQIWNTFAIWRRDYYSRRIVAIAILKNSSKYSAERRQCDVDQYDDRMHKGFRVTKAFFCMRVIWVHREFMTIASIQNICYFLWTPEKKYIGKKIYFRSDQFVGSRRRRASTPLVEKYRCRAQTMMHLLDNSQQFL